MSILATELEWPEGTKFFEVQCRLGIWDVDGWDLDKEPEVKTLGGTVRITPRTPAGRIRLLEPDGKYRVVVAPPLTFAINEFTGRLVNTADNTEGVWVVDPASDTVDPKDFTYSAVVTPKVGSPFTVEFDGTVAINGVYDLANGTTVAPSRGVSVLESRIAKLEQEGGLPHGVIPIFETLAEAMAYERENPGSLALTIEATEPDTTPPNPGTLKVAADAEFADLTVTGAWDDRMVSGYAFTTNADADTVIWSPWQAESVYRANNLAPSTRYLFAHKVRDAGLNESIGGAVEATTLDGPFTRIYDDFQVGSGTIARRVTPVGGFEWGSGNLADFIAAAPGNVVLSAGKMTNGGGVFTLPTNRAMISFDYGVTDASVGVKIRVAIGTDGTNDNRLSGYINVSPAMNEFRAFQGSGPTQLSIPSATNGFSIAEGGRVGFGFDGANLLVERNGERVSVALPSGVTLQGGYRYGVAIQSGSGWVDNVEVLPL